MPRMPAIAEPESNDQAQGAWELIRRLDKDMRKSARLLGKKQARYLVDLYYSIQKYRISAAAQGRSSAEGGEPSLLVTWLFEQMKVLETDIARAMGEFADEYASGKWLLSLTGIGPVLAAGLLSRLSIEWYNKDEQLQVADTVGHWWRFAGLDPTLRWEKSTKRPWNATLKTLLWKCGESFVKQQSRESDFYGKLYAQRKELEQQRNDQGKNALEADWTLTGLCPFCRNLPAPDPNCWKCRGELRVKPKAIGKDTDAYLWYAGCLSAKNAAELRHLDSEAKAKKMKKLAKDPGTYPGMLPPSQIHGRARRWAVKIFLSHLHETFWRDYYDTDPPVPFIFVKEPTRHTHYIAPPFPLPKEGKRLREMVE